MKALLATAGMALLAACAGPYDQALDSPVLMRPQPPVTLADTRAREPYDSSPFFRR